MNVIRRQNVASPPPFGRTGIKVWLRRPVGRVNPMPTLRIGCAHWVRSGSLLLATRLASAIVSDCQLAGTRASRL